LTKIESDNSKSLNYLSGDVRKGHNCYISFCSARVGK
jgi:hypothetical protein